jgi:hypothetical protein
MNDEFKGIGRMRPWPSQDTLLVLSRWADENHENFRIAGVSAEVRTEHLTYINVERSLILWLIC